MDLNINLPTGKTQIVNADLDKVKVLIPGWNYREPTREAHTNPALDTMAIVGQTEDGALFEMTEPVLKTWGQKYVQHGVKVGDLLPIRGNCRALKLKDLREAQAIDPLTVKRDDKGNVVPGSGKVFSTMRAAIYKDLDENAVAAMMNDHTSRRLSAAAVHQVLERAFERNPSWTEKDVAVSEFGLLLATNKRGKVTAEDTAIHTEEGRNRWAKVVRGRTQCAHNTIRGPVVLRQAYLDQLNNKRPRPTQDEVRALYSVWSKEIDENRKQSAPDPTITRSNPGPKFMAAWNEFERIQEEAKAEGKTAKTTAMMNAEAVNQRYDAAESIAFKLVLLVVKNKMTNGDQIVELDHLLTDYESKYPEFKASLLKLYNSVPNAAAAATPAATPPAATEPKADAA